MIWPARCALPQDHAALAVLWHGGWHDAHGKMTPAVVVTARPPSRFVARVAQRDDRARVAGPVGAPSGFCVIKGDEIDKLFLAREARGTGLAATLLADGEDRLHANGVTDARLVCVTGKLRAMRFYIRSGWLAVRETTVPADGFAPPMLLDVTLFGKFLTPDRSMS